MKRNDRNQAAKIISIVLVGVLGLGLISGAVISMAAMLGR